MKGTKVLLTAFAVLAIVGAALAFKPNYSNRICRVNPDLSTGTAICNPAGVDLTCATGAPQTSKKIVLGSTDCYRIVDATVTQCNTVTCPNLGKIATQP